MPAVSSRVPSRVALVRLAAPLGMGRSGLSMRSSSVSNTSLKTTPPPYKPMVASTSQYKGRRMGCARVKESSCSNRRMEPEAAKPSMMSAMAVMILAGRIKTRWA
jgi:hypothetical protein